MFCYYVPVIQKKIEQEKRRRHVLINEHNRLMFAVKEKEATLKELQESLTATNLHPTNYNSEDTCKQVSVHPDTFPGMLEPYRLTHSHHQCLTARTCTSASPGPHAHLPLSRCESHSASVTGWLRPLWLGQTSAKLV